MLQSCLYWIPNWSNILTIYLKYTRSFASVHLSQTNICYILSFRLKKQINVFNVNYVYLMLKFIDTSIISDIFVSLSYKLKKKIKILYYHIYIEKKYFFQITSQTTHKHLRFITLNVLRYFRVTYRDAIILW